MTKRFMNPNGKILVPVNLDETGEHLLKSAQQLSQRTGLALTVIHVSEYWVGRTWPTEMMLGGPMGGLVNSIEDETRELANKRLQDMVKKIIPNSKATCEVLLGYPAESIRAHATSTGAELILMGGATDEYRFVPKGLSTVLSLMNESPCPVLVLPKNTPGDWLKEPLNLLLADDLQPQTDSSVIIGYEWAAALGRVNLTHIHVNQMPKEDLKAALNSASAAAHLNFGAIDVDTVWTSSLKAVEEKLMQRAPGRKHLVEARGGNVKTALIHGQAVESLLDYANKNKTDVLIFGRHRTWRRKPFAIGQLPFHSMLRSKRPVLITE